MCWSNQGSLGAQRWLLAPAVTNIYISTANPSQPPVHSKQPLTEPDKWSTSLNVHSIAKCSQHLLFALAGFLFPLVHRVEAIKVFLVSSSCYTIKVFLVSSSCYTINASKTSSTISFRIKLFAYKYSYIPPTKHNRYKGEKGLMCFTLLCTRFVSSYIFYVSHDKYICIHQKNCMNQHKLELCQFIIIKKRMTIIYNT